MSGHSDTDSFKSVQDEHIAECRSRGSRPQHSHHDPLLQTPANKLGRLSLEEEAVRSFSTKWILSYGLEDFSATVDADKILGLIQ